MAELKPCPFCGGKAELVYAGSDYYRDIVQMVARFYVRCNVCGVYGKTYISDLRIRADGTVNEVSNGAVEATEAWNRRADDGA